MKDLSKLTKLQYQVTQEDATEAPHTNEFCEFFEEGLYLDIVSGEVLFSSKDKFHSHCGWPAFSKTVEENVVEKIDDSLRMRRIEVRSKKADSHLGHVFNDGPAPTGIRYCINSAALEFVARSELKNRGLESYEKIFED